MLRRMLVWATLGALLGMGAGAAIPQNAAVPAGGALDQAQLVKITESFVRDLYAWGPQFTLKLGPLAESPAAEYYRVPIEVTYNGQTDTGEVYVSKDGKSLLRGDLFDTQKPPYAAVRAHLKEAGNPALGPPDAAVTLVEFADFECPHCKEFHDNFRTIQQQFPNVRLVYKDFPLTDIHPWAETAAIAARCAFLASPAAFWQMHDKIFQEQDKVTPDNAWEEFNGFAKDQGLDTDAFKGCMSAPEAKKAVDDNHQDGVTLGVNSTPTVYVNGRPVVGGDPSTVVQYVQYELNAHVARNK